MNDKTTLGPTLEIEGEIEGGEDLIIQGRVNGKVTCSKTLTIALAGHVQASVSAPTLSVSGTLIGNAVAADRVEVTPEGRMVGDIKAPRVVIAEGAKFKGNIEMGVD